jgi:predicted aspartyl protease
LHEANVTVANPDDSIRFEYNPTFLPKTVDLQHNYMDAKGEIYTGNVSLPPFSSIVLMQIPSTIAVKNITKNTFNLSLFPNPAQQQVMLEYQLNEKSQVQITVFDTLGKVVLQTNKEQQLAGKQQVKLNISGLGTGVYYVEMKVNDGVVVEKLVVE